MARLIYSRAGRADIKRLADFLLESDPTIAGESVRLIEEAVQVLGNLPFIGRPDETGLRELVVSRGRPGYVVLCRFELARGLVLLFAVRHQREVGYFGDA